MRWVTPGPTRPWWRSGLGRDGISQVGADPVLQSRAPRRGYAPRDHHQSQCADEAEEGALHRRGHRSTRGSSGSRPIRSITR